MKNDIICPFRFSRGFKPFSCDNLVSGVPSCLVDNFYPDLSHEEMVARLKAGLSAMPNLVICKHFVRSNALYARFPPVKSKCFFSVCERCLHPLVSNYSACRDCAKFK